MLILVVLVVRVFGVSRFWVSNFWVALLILHAGFCFCLAGQRTIKFGFQCLPIVAIGCRFPPCFLFFVFLNFCFMSLMKCCGAGSITRVICVCLLEWEVLSF